MKKSTAIMIWLVINIVGLSFYGYMHYECIRDESVMRGRGSDAREITKKEDPEYYAKRMKGMWTGYIFIPLITAAVAYFRYRDANRNNDSPVNEKKR